MTRATDFLAALAGRAQEADAAEGRFRAEMEARAAALAHARAEAHRRANFLRLVATSAASAESPEAAEIAALSLIRNRFGWDQETPARAEVLTQFAPLARALHAAAQAEAGGENEDLNDPAKALADFENWYAETRESSFWDLFEHYMPETPRVDF
ncbi:hypothetical protein J5J86_09405 [Aquabacter sp. L1I39]|uniref:hypothetical protein n=1 Tax=Aquabacter sp. L1I39 TaxID=2820278 RepID=UPI001ADC5734|nr:hypothetical protein [Aquabacter sp. L1I39]QTL05470.1 hypothetical protein J5J86_09405 [Aquabacter sp. L1I39]